jgi:hypothetical protein
MWKLQKREAIRQRIVLRISFDMESRDSDDAEKRTTKLINEWMPSVMNRLGPWLESKHRQIDLVEVHQVDPEVTNPD